jgi:hypothetical protein
MVKGTNMDDNTLRNGTTAADKSLNRLHEGDAPDCCCGGAPMQQWTSTGILPWDEPLVEDSFGQPID